MKLSVVNCRPRRKRLLGSRLLRCFIQDMPTPDEPSGRQADRERLDPAQEVRIRIDRLSHHLDLEVAPYHFFPQDLELHLGEPVAQAAVDAETKRQVLARPAAI